MLDGQVNAVVGAHTHVQTSDKQIVPGGTASLTDAGFTGAHESVLGRDLEPVIKRFVTNLPPALHRRHRAGIPARRVDRVGPVHRQGPEHPARLGTDAGREFLNGPANTRVESRQDREPAGFASRAMLTHFPFARRGLFAKLRLKCKPKTIP